MAHLKKYILKQCNFIECQDTKKQLYNVKITKKVL